MLVAEVKDSLSPVRRESTEIVVKVGLYALAAVVVLLLCYSQISLKNPKKVLNVYRYLFTFLSA